MLLGPVDDGVIGPEAEPIVRGQSSNVVTQEKEDAQKGDEKSDRLHVVPVHGQLDLQSRGEKASAGTPATIPPRAGTPVAAGPSCPPGPCLHSYSWHIPLSYLTKSA